MSSHSPAFRRKCAWYAICDGKPRGRHIRNSCLARQASNTGRLLPITSGMPTSHDVGGRKSDEEYSQGTRDISGVDGDVFRSPGPESAANGQSPEPWSRAACGEVSPLIPMQGAEADHMGLVWKKNSAVPQDPLPRAVPRIHRQRRLRPGARRPGDQPRCLHDQRAAAQLVLEGRLARLRPLPRPRHRALSRRASFQRLTYGGYLMRQGLSQSVPTRIRANRTMERQLIFDLETSRRGSPIPESSTPRSWTKPTSR